jgi:branched-chain amino acid transport system permease protein
LAASAAAGALIELVVIRRLYSRDHLDQVLATFALILILSEATRWRSARSRCSSTSPRR